MSEHNLNKVLILLFISLQFMSGCKDEHWGDAALNFAHEEAPTIINELSKKDLESKWFNFTVYNLNFGMEEINKAQLLMNSFKPFDLSHLNNDQIKLMSTAYQVDQHIEKAYFIKNLIFNAKDSINKLDMACSDLSLLNYYTDNRIYLYNSLQMAVPQINVTYSATVTFSYGNYSPGKNEGGGGIDSIPLIGNVFSYFTQKSFEKNLGKFKEAQNVINNITLNHDQLILDSNQICNSKKAALNDSIDILRKNIKTVEENFKRLYSLLIATRNALAPQVIQNIVNGFSSEEKEIYQVIEDNNFTNRIMQISTFAKSLRPQPINQSTELIKTEQTIDTINDLLSELSKMTNNSLATNKQNLITNTTKLLQIKLDLYNNYFKNGVNK